MRFHKLMCWAVTLTALTPMLALAQDGVSSASMGVARSGFHRVGPDGKYRMPSPDLFRVEEFVNYHKHDLPLPGKGQRLQLNVKKMSIGSKKWLLQIGLATPRSVARDKIPPLNLVLVVDRSGSMGGSKMMHLKNAIRELVENFRPQDQITIVGFSSDARVHLEPARKTEQSRIVNAIKEIHAGGGTNLYAGLKLGFERAEKNFDREKTNRIIFLTDGNANVGVTEKETISKLSKTCHGKGISLMTIGLGIDFNNGLLRELADAGRGVIHYIGDEADIQKTFVREVESLIAPAANQLKLTLDLKKENNPEFFGYHVKEKGKGSHVIKLDDINCGATQVVLVKLSKEHSRGVVRLKYRDAVTSENHELSVELRKIEECAADCQSIKQNYAIGLLASSIKLASEASNEGDNQLAAKKIRKAVSKVEKLLDRQLDKHVVRVMEIAKEYLGHLGEDAAGSSDSIVRRRVK